MLYKKDIPKESIIYNKHNFHPKWGDWSWVVDLDLKSIMLKHFYKALITIFY